MFERLKPKLMNSMKSWTASDVARVAARTVVTTSSILLFTYLFFGGLRSGEWVYAFAALVPISVWLLLSWFAEPVGSWLSLWAVMNLLAERPYGYELPVVVLASSGVFLTYSFLRRRVDPHIVRSLAILAFVTVGVWHLFGSPVREIPTQGIVTMHRFAGRILRTTIDTNRDGKWDVTVHFSWQYPYPGQITTECQVGFDVVEHDSDFDGRPDIWVYPGGPSGNDTCFSRVNVDSDGDGVPDWSQEFPFAEANDFVRKIKQRVRETGTFQGVQEQLTENTGVNAWLQR